MPSACPRDRYLSCSALLRSIHCTYRHTQRHACPVDTTFTASCSKERNDPPGKPVAFKAASMLSGVAGNVTSTGQAGGIQGSFDALRCSKERNDPPGKPVAFKAASMLSGVARNERSTGQAGGIQGSFDALRCSKERNDPPGKPVAFKAASMLSGVAGNVTIHRASRCIPLTLPIQQSIIV